MKTNENWLEEARELAKAKLGACLSTCYTGAKNKMDWECSEGHRWSAPLSRIKYQGCWCPFCSKKAKSTIEIAINLAKKRGGRCLSDVYKNSFSPMLWECSLGHQWQACLDRIKNGGSWCPTCSGKNRYSIFSCQSIAIDRGGKCLSESYVNNSTKMDWECSEGHRWASPLATVLQDTWCGECSGFKKLTLAHAQDAASKQGGKCLSKEYHHNKHPMLWECSLGHQWQACFNNIKHGGDGTGTWCPVCRKKRTKSENSMYEFVKSIGIDCHHDWPGILPSKLLRFDIWIPSMNKAIELDGKYWHDRPDTKERDMRKNLESSALGIEVLRIDYETEWNRNKRPIGQNKIRAFLGLKEPLCSECGIGTRIFQRTICGSCLAGAQQKYKKATRYPDGQRCVHCRKWCKKARDLSCKKCRNISGLRICNVCELVLPIEGFFYGKEPYCKWCRLA